MTDNAADDNNPDQIVVTAPTTPQDAAFLQQAKPNFVTPQSDPRAQHLLDNENFLQYRLAQGDSLGDALDRSRILAEGFDLHGGMSSPEIGDLRPNSAVQYDKAFLNELGYENAHPSGRYENEESIRRDTSIALRAQGVSPQTANTQQNIDDLSSANRALAGGILTPETTGDYLADMEDDREAGRLNTLDPTKDEPSQLNEIFSESNEDGQWNAYEGEHIEGSILALDTKAEQARISGSLSAAGITNVTGQQTDGQHIVIVPNGELSEISNDDALQAVNLLEESRPESPPSIDNQQQATAEPTAPPPAAPMP